MAPTLALAQIQIELITFSNFTISDKNRRMVDQQGDPLLNSLVAAYLAKVAPKVGASFQKTVKVRFSQVCPISVSLSLEVKIVHDRLYMTIPTGWCCSWRYCGVEGGCSTFLQHSAPSKESRLGQWR